jgi:hypothetical protein
MVDAMFYLGEILVIFLQRNWIFFSSVNSIYFAIYLVKFHQIFDTTEKKKEKRANVIFC